MKALIFIIEIFRKFPRLLIANIVLLILVSGFNACSLFTISPLVDFLIHPDLQDISPMTQKAVDILKALGWPVTLGSGIFIFAAFITLSSAFNVLARYSILKTKYAVLYDLIRGTFDDFMNARWYFFSSEKQGVLLNTLIRELSVVGNAFGSMALFFANILQILCYLAVPFYISWQVSCISLGAALLFAVPFILLGKLSYRLGLLNTSTANKVSAVIQENLSMAKVVLGFGNQKTSIDSLAVAFNEHRRATLKSQILTISIPILYRPFSVLMVIIALFAARHFSVPLSEIMVLLLALLQVAVSISNVTMYKNSLENFFPSYEQIKSLREKAKRLKQESGGCPFKGFESELILENISFAYPDRGSVLEDIDVCISKGKMVAFVGESGVGKSTLIDLIMGFHQPTKGKILFDKKDLREFNMESYRRRIGYVPQDSALFNMSIRDNLLWSCESATDEEIRWACQQASAEEFIKELDDEYDTIVGDRGVRLSGGQIQRVALARALLRKPEILILDEATSSLDTYSERLIQQAIENISKETTVIAVAHRLSTIKSADCIYVLKGGRIVEEGTYDTLMAQGGHFSSMVELQELK